MGIDENRVFVTDINKRLQLSGCIGCLSPHQQTLHRLLQEVNLQNSQHSTGPWARHCRGRERETSNISKTWPTSLLVDELQRPVYVAESLLSQSSLDRVKYTDLQDKQLLVSPH